MPIDFSRLVLRSYMVSMPRQFSLRAALVVLTGLAIEAGAIRAMLLMGNGVGSLAVGLGSLAVISFLASCQLRSERKRAAPGQGPP
jgi:hypothetical protein